MFFWQASQEVEEVEATPKRDPLKYAPRQAEGALGRIRLDTYIGMAFSNLVAIAINITTAATLHVAGTTNIQTSSEAAEATYSQVGAQFGFSISWTMLFSYPLMAAIQEISGRRRTTGRGVAGNIRRHYPAWLLHTIVGLLFIANTINIGVDLGGMGDGLPPIQRSWANLQ